MITETGLVFILNHDIYNYTPLRTKVVHLIIYMPGETACC